MEINTPTSNALVQPDENRKFFGFLLWCVFGLLFCVVTIFKTQDSDIWYHLKAGEYIYQHHAVLHTDIFSATAAGNQWIAHEWLFELLSFLVFAAAGINGLIVCKALVILVTYALVYRIARKINADPFVSIIVMSLAIFFAGNRFDIRAHLVTDLFLALLLLALVTLGDKKGTVLRTVPFFLLFFLWAQLHSGFLFGFLLIGIFLVAALFARNRQRVVFLAKLLAVAVAASLINPSGYNVLLLPFLVMDKTLAFHSVNEYLSPFSPTHAGIVTLVFAVFLVVGVISFLPFLGKKQRQGLETGYYLPVGLLIFLVFGILSCRMIRNLSMCAVLTAPFVAANITSIATRYRPKALGNAIVAMVAAAVIAAIGYNYKDRIGMGVEPGFFSDTAVEFLRANTLKGEMFNAYSQGGFLIWKLFPRYKVFIDGRTDVYDARVLEDYDNFVVGATDVEGILSRRNIGYVVLKVTETNPNTLAYLLLNDNWGVVFFDMPFTIFCRAAAGNGQVIAQHSYKAYVKMGDSFATNAYMWQLGIIAYQRAMAITDTAEIHVKLAAIYESARHPADAQREYESACRIDPKSIAAYTNLGSLYAAQNDFEKAKVAWKKAAEIDPDSLAAKNLKMLEEMKKVAP